MSFDGSHRCRAMSLATWLQRRDSVCTARITLMAELLTTSRASPGSMKYHQLICTHQHPLMLFIICRGGLTFWWGELELRGHTSRD